MPKPIYLFSISTHPDAKSVKSLDIKFLKPQIDFSKYDYLVVTSKQAVKALQQYEKESYTSLAALCVSTQSALAFEKAGGKVLEIGAGYGDNLVSKIKTYTKDTKWLYLRAESVASDFADICRQDGYHVDEKIVYVTECSQEILDVKVEDKAVLIFTSPSSLQCFLKKHTIHKSNSVVVIGESTAAALPKEVECHMSEKTTIESCIELAKNL